MLAELLKTVNRASHMVAVGVNDSLDRTAEIARRYPVVVAETDRRGYGHGCMAAIGAVNAQHPSVSAYVFFAGDGASDPRDIAPLAAAAAQGYQLVLGGRTMSRSNWAAMSFPHVLANLTLGLWCGLLTGRWFSDLAPLRLIERQLFETLALKEMTFGWTIEAQIGAAMLGAATCEVSARERTRLAGEQKVSGVTWRRTFSIGCRILAAGWRARIRFGKQRRLEPRRSAADVAARAQVSA